jgi:hypothetical protein
MKFASVLLIGLFLISVASADIGPSPDAPDITIRFELDNAKYFRINKVIYHCQGTTNESSNPVETGTIELSCVDEVCINNNWYYKLNPCFYSSGYLSYEYEGKTMQTGWLNFTDSRTYDYGVDVETGEFTSQVAVPKEMYDFCCAPSFILPLFLGLVFFMGRRNG